jgi:hypothetical protein
VINDDGGTAAATDFDVRVDDDPVDLADETPDAGFDSQASATLDDLLPGDYTVSEVLGGLADAYSLEGIECSDETSGETEATVTLGLGDDVTCWVVNDDQPGELILVKEFDGDTALYPDVDQDDFTPLIDGDAAEWGSNPVAGGNYTVGEEEDADGSTHLADGTFVLTSVECDGEETTQVTVPNGGSAECVLTNTAVGAGLTVVKQVINDWGGELGPADFPLRISGTLVASGEAVNRPAGNYVVSEEQQEGYELASSSCTRDGEAVDGISGESFAISVRPDETVVCTFVNRDIPATVTLVKTVVNDNGGTATEDDFTPSIDGGATSWDTVVSIAAGDHTVAETTLPGYTAGAWGGDCAANGTLTAELGGTYTCTITNDDLPIGIQVVKVADQETVTFDPANPPVVTYTYVVTNTGQTTLTDVTLVDDVLGPISLPDTTLDPGELVIGTATHTVTAADAAAGQIVNVAVVTGESPDGRTATDDDREDVFIDEVEVQPTVIVQPVPVLPATGANTGVFALWAALLAGLGAMFLLLVRDPAVAELRRRKD